MKKAPSSRHTKTNDGSRASWANVRNRQRTQKGINNGPNLIARPAEVQNVEVIFHRLSKKPLFQGPFVPLQTKKLARTHTKEKSRVVVLRARAATSCSSAASTQKTWPTAAAGGNGRGGLIVYTLQQGQKKYVAATAAMPHADNTSDRHRQLGEWSAAAKYCRFHICRKRTKKRKHSLIFRRLPFDVFAFHLSRHTSAQQETIIQPSSATTRGNPGAHCTGGRIDRLARRNVRR
jgi:hypothetical protein